MAYDPVLDRQMFQNRDTKSRGMDASDTTYDTTTSDLKSRREQAAALIEASKKKFDPSNFQTLSEQERPEVFRPVAVNMPAPQQTESTAQRMQQMAAQGVQQPVQQQPVQMAIGGLAHFTKGGYIAGSAYGPYDASKALAELGLANNPLENGANDYGLPSYSVTPTVDDFNTLGNRFKKIKSDVQGIGSLKEPTKDKIEPTVTPASSPQKEPTPSIYELLDPDPTNWSDADINDVAMRVSRQSEGGAGKATTRAGRALQGIMGLPTSSSADDIANSLRAEREMAIQGGKNATSDKIPDILDTQAKKQAIEAATPIPGALETSTEEDVAAAQEARSSALAKAESERTGQLANVAGGSGDYMSKVPNTGIASIPPTISDAQTAGGSGDYMSNAPSSGIADLRQATGTPQGSLDAMDAGQPITSATGTPQGSLDAMAPSAPSAPSAPGPSSDAATKALDAYNTAKTESTNTPSDTSGGLTMEDIKARRNQERQDNFNLALMQAGLAIAGGKSSNALTNIGEGGVSGVQAFTKGEQESRTLERERTADLRAIQQMKNEQAYRQATLGLTATSQAQTAAYQQGTLAQQKAALNQSLDEFNQNLDLKKQEFANNIQVAVTNRDATLAKTTSEQITSQLNNLETARARIASNVQLNIMAPEEAKIQLQRFDRAEAELKAQANALRSRVGSTLGISLSPQEAGADTSGWKYLGASTGAK